LNVLVIGGSRFIGLHLVKLLHAQGHDVSVLNRGQTTVEFPDGITRLQADRYDSAQIRSALAGKSFDAAYDISGYDVPSLEPLMKTLEGNIGSFIFCSTTAVYAPSDTFLVSEVFPLHRSSPRKYSTDKIACEDFLEEVSKRSNTPVTIIRPPYVYGPDNYIASREFSFFARLSQGRKVIVPGDGLNLLHLVHVDDLANAFASVLGNQQAANQTYTVASPDMITTGGFVQTIANVMDMSVEIVHADAIEYDKQGRQFYPYEHSLSQAYSTDKARRELDWSPQYHMRDGLEMTYRWWLEQDLSKETWDFSAEDEFLSGK